MGILTLLQGPLPITPLTSLSPIDLQKLGYSRTWLLKAIQGQVNLLLMLKKSPDRGRSWILLSVPAREEKKSSLY